MRKAVRCRAGRPSQELGCTFSLLHLLRDDDRRQLAQVDSPVGVSAELDLVARVQGLGGLTSLRGVAVDHHALRVEARVAVLDDAPWCGAPSAG